MSIVFALVFAARVLCKYVFIENSKNELITPQNRHLETTTFMGVDIRSFLENEELDKERRNTYIHTYFLLEIANCLLK